MNNTLCHVSAQHYENYGDAKSPHWKPKGEQIFKIYVDADHFLYGEEFCIKAIKKCLEKESNDFDKYEYRSHELIFNEPIELKDFGSILEKLFDDYAISKNIGQ